MLKHHLLHVVTGAGWTWRYLLRYCRVSLRMMVFALYRLEFPRAHSRTSLRERNSEAPPAKRVTRRSKLQASPLLIHYHIFKNAGTSFERALQQNFGSGLRRFDLTDPNGFVSAHDIVRFVEANPNTRAIASHQAAPPGPSIRGRRVMTSLLIRDPIARVRSIYAYERRQPNDNAGTRKARELDFKSYVEWRLVATPRMFCNYQVHFCCRDGSAARPIASQAELTKAIANLDCVDIVGTVERYGEWLSLAESILSASFGQIKLACGHHNQNTESHDLHSESEILKRLVGEIGSDLAHRLLELNELDMRLHQVADSLLTRRLAERSVWIRLRETYNQELDELEIDLES